MLIVDCLDNKGYILPLVALIRELAKKDTKKPNFFFKKRAHFPFAELCDIKASKEVDSLIAHIRMEKILLFHHSSKTKDAVIEEYTKRMPPGHKRLPEERY